MKVKILGIGIDDYTREELLLMLEKALGENKKRFILTANPEMLVMGQRDRSYFEAIKGADIIVADGVGVILASILAGKRIRNRITGVDLMMALCQGIKSQKVLLLGARGDSAKRAAEALTRKNPGNQYFFIGDLHADETNLSIQYINSVGPSVLFVAFGQPKQEMWISDHLGKLNSVKVAMGVGGSFDFISGKVKRAPNWMRNIGLEWLYRLSRQPFRAIRVFNATLYFSYLTLRNINKH